MATVASKQQKELKKGMKDYVADLTANDISEMKNDELVYAIRTVAEQFGLEQRIDRMDRETLVKMTFLARRCCRTEGFGDTAVHLAS